LDERKLVATGAREVIEAKIAAGVTDLNLNLNSGVGGRRRFGIADIMSYGQETRGFAAVTGG
jgi:hypothetical protein